MRLNMSKTEKKALNDMVKANINLAKARTKANKALDNLNKAHDKAVAAYKNWYKS